MNIVKIDTMGTNSQRIQFGIPFIKSIFFYLEYFRWSNAFAFHLLISVVSIPRDSQKLLMAGYMAYAFNLTYGLFHIFKFEDTKVRIVYIK